MPGNIKLPTLSTELLVYTGSSNTGLEFHFFVGRGVSLPTFMIGGELKFLGLINKTLSLFYILLFNLL